MVTWTPRQELRWDRGVTTLDGAWGKKQVWRPHVRTWVRSEANVLYWWKYLRQFWDFSSRRNDSAPGELCPPCPLTLRSCAESKGTWLTIPPSRHRHKSTTKDSNTNTKIQKISTVTITIAFHCNNSNRISAFRIALHSNPQKNGWWSYWTSDLTWKRSHRAFRNLTISSFRLYALIEILNQILSLNSVMATITECCL